jgi:hypothetical protein
MPLAGTARSLTESGKRNRSMVEVSAFHGMVSGLQEMACKCPGDFISIAGCSVTVSTAYAEPMVSNLIVAGHAYGADFVVSGGGCNFRVMEKPRPRPQARRRKSTADSLLYDWH